MNYLSGSYPVSSPKTVCLECVRNAIYLATSVAVSDFAFVMDKSYPICKPIKKCIIDPLGSSVLRWTVWWP